MTQHPSAPLREAATVSNMHDSHLPLVAAALVLAFAANAFSQGNPPATPPPPLAPVGPLLDPAGYPLENADVFMLTLRSQAGAVLSGTSVTASMYGFASGIVGVTDSEGCIAYRCPPGLLRLSYSDPASGPQNVAYRKAPGLAHGEVHFTGDSGLENHSPTDEMDEDIITLDFSHVSPGDPFGEYVVFGGTDGSVTHDANMDGKIDHLDGPLVDFCSLCPNNPTQTITFTATVTEGTSTTAGESFSGTVSRGKEKETSIKLSNGSLTSWYVDVEGGVTWKTSASATVGGETSSTESASQSRSTSVTMSHECGYTGTEPYRQHHELRMSYTRHWSLVLWRAQSASPRPNSLTLKRSELHLYAQHWRIVPSKPTWSTYDGEPCYTTSVQLPPRKGRNPRRFSPPLPGSDLPPMPIEPYLWVSIPLLEGWNGLKLAGLAFPERTFPVPQSTQDVVDILNNPDLQVRPAGWSVTKL